MYMSESQCDDAVSECAVDSPEVEECDSANSASRNNARDSSFVYEQQLANNSLTTLCRLNKRMILLDTGSYKFDDRDAKAVFWHSSAHMLSEALENTPLA
eukprot:scaffold201592_cov69-Attheya_sp.AAC.3